MPGQGSTSRECVACHAIINVACKTCKICKAGQPHKLRLKKKLAKFDEKRESWVQTNKKNRTVSHIHDEANILLEKLQALGVRAMLFTAKPGKKPNTWLSEVLAPRCQLTEYATTCVDRMKDLYGLLVHDWVPQDATEQLDEPSSAPVEPPIGPVAPPDPQQTLAPPDPPAAPTGPLMAQPDPPVAVASFYPTATSATSVKSLTRPPAAQTEPSSSGPHSSEGTPATPVSLEKDDIEEGCSAPSAVLRRKRKECPHTVSGSQDFYPVKRVAKCKVVKGQKLKLVEWEPCKLCGKDWPLEWVPEKDTTC